jgi:hypothetical protein
LGGQICGRTSLQGTLKQVLVAVAALPILLSSGCRTTAGKPEGSFSSVCDVLGPPEQKPAVLQDLRLGMSRSAVESLLGAPVYSPAQGLSYYLIGGDCWIEELGRAVPCGVVADYRPAAADGAKTTSKELLESCWWGPLAE